MANGKTIADMSADSRAVYQRLTATKIGDVVTYAELDKLTGRNVQNGDRYILQTAMRACLRDGLAFGIVRKIGAKRLADAEIVIEASAALPRIRHLAKRASRKMVAVADFASLPNEMKVRHNSVLSIFGAVAHMSTEKAVTKIEKRVAEANQTLALANTLEAFK